MNARHARITITLFFGVAFAIVAWRFFVPLIIGAAIALLLQPIFDYLVSRKSWRAELTAGLLTLGVTVLLILPATLLSIRGIRFGASRFQSWKESPFLDSPGADASLLDSLIQIPLVSALITKVAGVLRMEEADLIATSGAGLKNVGLRLADLFASVLSSLPAVAIALFLLILAIYFFLADGPRVVRFFRTNSFFPEQETEEIFYRFKGLCRAVLLASLVSGLVQAAIYLIGGAIAGIDDLMVLGFCVFIGSFIPVVGAGPITFGLASYFLVTGHRFVGVTLLISAIIASFADNFVRPFVLRGGANLHPLIAIVALFGGLQLFGFAGVFIGPIVAGMFFVFLEAHVKTRHLH